MVAISKLSYLLEESSSVILRKKSKFSPQTFFLMSARNIILMMFNLDINGRSISLLPICKHGRHNNEKSLSVVADKLE